MELGNDQGYASLTDYTRVDARWVVDTTRQDHAVREQRVTDYLDSALTWQLLLLAFGIPRNFKLTGLTISNSAP
jgi:hypothetical protein